MPSAIEPDELCEEHWLSAFGYDGRAYPTHKDLLDVELVSAYTDVYAVYDVYVYFYFSLFIFICQMVVTIKHMGCIWHGCNGQGLDGVKCCYSISQ